MKKQISNLDSGVDNARRLEEELKRKIARLLEREARLAKRKSMAQTKIDKLSDRLNKINKITEVISDL